MMLSVKTSNQPVDAHRDIVLDAIARETVDHKTEMDKQGKEYCFTLSIDGVEWVEARGDMPTKVSPLRPYRIDPSVSHVWTVQIRATDSRQDRSDWPAETNACLDNNLICILS